MDLDVAGNFLVALLIGALVGIEREKKKVSEPAHAFGGIRTYTLLALVGAASAWLGQVLAMPWIFGVVLGVVGAAVVASHWLQNHAEAERAPGLTSEVAALAVCLLGAMAVVGDRALAVALGIVTSAVLAYKQPLHGLVARVGMEDLLAVIKLLVASFIVLPLLPDAPVDPWGAIHPAKLWLLVILISALSLVGYGAMRWLGTAHGTAITGLAGGLVSSTATTLSFARQSREAGDGAVAGHALAAGVLLSWWVMVGRVLVLVAIVNRAALAQVWPPLAAMALVTGLLMAWHYRAGLAHRQDGEDQPRVRNPFSLVSAMQFGALFAGVLLAVKIAQQQAPGWVVGVAALAGSVDVDAITLSLAGDARDAAAAAQLGLALTAAAVSNTLVKCAMVVALGRGALRRHVALATLAIVAAGGITAVWRG
jgi:uncharacterized membrane protein (DUF4010 family)